MIAGALFGLAVACGASTSKTTQRQPVDSGGGGSAATASQPVDPASICQRIFELRDELKCDFARTYDLSRDECIDEFQRSLETRGPAARKATVAAASCFEQPSCDRVSACMATLPSPPPPKEALRPCKNPPMDLAAAAVGYPKGVWENRKGAKSVRFSDTPSTKESPIEVCEIPSEMEWLLRVTCDNGSHPFRSYDHAHSARVGNVGPGGKCDAIIDLYEVPCEEKTYRVYIDAYSCPMDSI